MLTDDHGTTVFSTSKQAAFHEDRNTALGEALVFVLMELHEEVADLRRYVNELRGE